MGVELVPAATLDAAGLADLFTAGYSEYLVPIHADETLFSTIVRWWDVDLEASRVAMRGREPVGIALLGLRGSEGWIGGLGVVPAARREGVGETLMRAVLDEARARGTRTVRLEVIRENLGAIALYERLGFERVRDLRVWSVPGTPSRVEGVPVAEAHRLIVVGRAHREPWQRSDATLANLDRLQAIADEGAAAIVRVTGERVALVQAGGAAAGLEAVVRGAAALGDSLHATNVDPDDPLSAALAAAGGGVDVTQHEYALELA